MDTRRGSNVVAGLAVIGSGVAELAIMGRAVTPLVVALGIAYALWASRSVWQRSSRTLLVYGAALVAQCAHLVEEYRTGLYEAFPPVFGAEPWSSSRFLLFNLAWIGIFILGLFGLAHRRRWAYLIALFLAIGGGVGNGLGHLALVLVRGRYFPGAYTAVLVLVAGSVLLRDLIGVRVEFNKSTAPAEQNDSQA
jgi:hypothetical protein